MAASAAGGASAQLSAEGTELVLRTDDGRVLRSADLVGATLMIGTGADQLAIRIESVEEDPYSIGGDVYLHRVVATDASGESWNYCEPDAEGRNAGFPVPDGHGGFELTCTSGAVGKCIRWGYRPWEEGPGGSPLRAMHAACTHMARADYGGDGTPHTRDGTLIFFCDRYGINSCGDVASEGMAFEAAWGVDGAVCLARPRIPELATLHDLIQDYPRLASQAGPQACTLKSANENPDAILFNLSGL